jgi:hypothetical protein
LFEKKQRINNPLTLITIFSGIPIVSIYAIKYVSLELQFIFICFVIGFTVLLTLLTFTILFFKPEVLYAPNDYRNDENFLITMKLKKAKARIRGAENK